MGHICKKEFEKQPKEIQKILASYFIQHCQGTDLIYVDEELMLQKQYGDGWNLEDGVFPCYTEEWLRRYIQDKGYKYIGINNFLELENKETWRLKVFKSMKQFEPNVEAIGNTALECFWQIAIQISEEESEELKINEAMKQSFINNIHETITKEKTKESE